MAAVTQSDTANKLRGNRDKFIASKSSHPFLIPING